MSKNIYSLLIDASSKKPLLILAKKDLVIICKELTSTNKNSSYQLLPEIKQIFTRNNCYLKDLSYIAVGKGPGSYTGIRTAVAIASGLSYGLKIPLINFFSPLCYIPKVFGKFCIITSTNSKGLYLFTGEKKTKNLSFQKKPFFFSTYKLARQHLKNTDLIFSSQYKEIQQFFPDLSLQKPIINSSYLASVCYTKYLERDYSLDNKVDICYFKNP